MIPFSGRHDLIQHRFDKGYDAGTADRVTLMPGGLTDTTMFVLGTDSPGVYTSEEVRTRFGANELVLTWNADVPAGANLTIRFRVAGESGWSGWFDMGVWRSDMATERNTEDAAFGKLKVDQLVTAVKFHAIQYRVEFRPSPDGAHPVLRMVSLCYSHVGEGEPDMELMKAANGREISLRVPWMSQLRPEDVDDPEMIKAGVCAPTSMTMVLNYYGVGARISEIGRHAFDPVAKIFGNWAFLSATAGDYGFSTYVRRFNNWSEIRKLIAAGAPVIISIAYPKGTFKDNPEKFSNGHLLVVRGFTKDGDVICNDPGTAHQETGDGVIYRWQELGVAFFGHGGVGIVVKKQGMFTG